MAEEETKKVETETHSDPSPPPPEPVVEAPPAAEEKSVVPPPEDKPEESKALVVVEAVSETVEGKAEEGSVNRDVVLARVETQKRLSLIKAWEESEKSKVENKSHKKISGVVSWENSKKASLEADLKKMEEKLEKAKAEYAEKIKNQMALLHKEAEEKRAFIEAKRGEELLKAEEMAAKCRAKGTTPKKPLLGCI